MFSPLPQLENSPPGVNLLLSLPTLTFTPSHYPDCCLSLSTTLLHFLSSLFLSLRSSAQSPFPSATSTAAAAATTTVTPQSVLTVFSIGSGTGLLEALLTRHIADSNSGISPSHQRANLVGVEVYASPPVNKYLDGDHVCLVRGTWDVCEAATTAASAAAAAAAAVWMFVYPRHVSLVEKYIETLRSGLEEEEEEGEEYEEGGGGREKGMAVQMIIWAGPRADVVDYEGVFGKLQARGWVREEEEEGAVVGIAGWEAVVVLRRG